MRLFDIFINYRLYQKAIFEIDIIYPGIRIQNLAFQQPELRLAESFMLVTNQVIFNINYYFIDVFKINTHLTQLQILPE